MNESDWNEYNQLARDAAGDANQMALLDLAFKDQDFVYNGVWSRVVVYAVNVKGGFLNNNNVVTEEFVGCGMPNKNKQKAAINWATQLQMACKILKMLVPLL